MTSTWFISDTHNQNAQLRVPAEVDAVTHCGDDSSARKTADNELEARAFFSWYQSLEIPTKIFIPGNHSTAVENGIVRPEEYPTIQFLVHQAYQWQGLRIFGSPYTPWFFEWAYNIKRPELEPLWAEIPAGIDVLITHGPPKGILDVTRDYRSKELIHIGSRSLTRHVLERIRPRIHAFGHLHDEAGVCNYGLELRDEVQFVNCACCELSGELVHHGQVIEL